MCTAPGAVGQRGVNLHRGAHGQAVVVGGQSQGGALLLLMSSPAGWMPQGGHSLDHSARQSLPTSLPLQILTDIPCHSWFLRCIAPPPQPWCEMMQQDKVALRFWKAEGVLHYTCVDTGALCCAVPCRAVPCCAGPCCAMLCTAWCWRWLAALLPHQLLRPLPPPRLFTAVLCILPPWRVHVCAGPTEQFGMPGPGVTVDQKRRYPDVVDTFGQPHYDAVLVDGRCACSSYQW